MSELVVLTGASRGIGRATARAFAKRGCRLALLGRASPRLDEAVEECRAIGVEAHRYAFELTDAAALAQAVSSLLEAQGPPRVVVNNAGDLVRGPRVHETRIEDWDRVLAVNLRAPFLLCRALLPAMLEAGRGRLVHVSSISGTLGSPGAAPYSASKWGLIGLSKSLAEELKDTGLQSVALLPGSTDTDMLAQTPFPPRMSADDVARMLVFLGLDAPDAVQGSAVEMFG
ncbi:MAG: SDR family oxidoreductase [Deltaproteobacteria bacterium]|nr:SDR family oxidoreductase [Deltaproteobacteria bacterium]